MRNAVGKDRAVVLHRHLGIRDALDRLPGNTRRRNLRRRKNGTERVGRIRESIVARFRIFRRRIKLHDGSAERFDLPLELLPEQHRKGRVGDSERLVPLGSRASERRAAAGGDRQDNQGYFRIHRFISSIRSMRSCMVGSCFAGAVVFSHGNGNISVIGRRSLRSSWIQVATHTAHRLALPRLPLSIALAFRPAEPRVDELCGRQAFEGFGRQSHLPDGDGEPPLVGYRLRLPVVGRFPFFERSPNLSVSGAMLSTKSSETARMSDGSSSKMSHTSSSV